MDPQKSHLVAESLVKESDRGCVILGASLLAEALETLIRSVSRNTPDDIKTTIDPLFQGYAPLSTFSARLQIAFALGILPKNLRDKIEIIRRMRNDFAHEWGPIDFNEPRFASRLQFIVKQAEPVKEQEQENGSCYETVWSSWTNQRTASYANRLRTGCKSHTYRY
jgi:DNA-binding MltR family transcriptional regulator